MVLAKSLQGRTYKKRPRSQVDYRKKQQTVKNLARQVKAVRNEGQTLSVAQFPTMFIGATLTADTPKFDNSTELDPSYRDIFFNGSAIDFVDGDRLIRAHFNVAWDNVAAGSVAATCRLILVKDIQADKGAPTASDVLSLSTTYSQYGNRVLPTYLGIKRTDSRLTNANNLAIGVREYRYEVMYDKIVTLSDSGAGENKVWVMDIDFYGAKRDIDNIRYHFIAISDVAAIITVTGNYVYKKT